MKIKIFDGSLSTLLSDKLFFDYPAEKIWNPNGISLKKRITNDKSFRAKVNVALNPDNLRKYVVPVDDSAPTRCIDGRMTMGWENLDKASQRSLGPKMAGGTPHAALASRIVESTDIKENLRFEDDIAYVVERYQEIGKGFGGHVDTHAHGWDGWNTGCGAVDNINLILDKLQRPEPQEQLRGLAQMIMGEANSSFIVNEVIGRMLFLDALKPSYMPKENGNPSGHFLYKKTIVDLLRKQARNNAEVVPQLVGDHNEVALVLNFTVNTTFDTDRFSFDNVNTTFDTDRFSFDNNGEIQVFGWDIWEMYEEARLLYPYSMQAEWHDQKESISKRIKHVTTRTLLGISTAMVLTDGSLKVAKIYGKHQA